MKFLTSILAAAIMLASCTTTKVNSVTGERTLTANAKHFQKVYKKQGGFYAGGKWVSLIDLNKKIKK